MKLVVEDINRVIVVGLDGLEPTLVESLIEAGRLPNLAKLKTVGRYSRIKTTYPAQTPVAWSTFSTGTNPGGHGIYDFIHRDLRTHLPKLSLNRYEQKNIFSPAKAVNGRGGTPMWDLLSRAGIPSIVIRCPCSYPPDEVRGRMLAGVGVPDMRGGFGTATFYSSSDKLTEQEGETVLRVRSERDRVVKTHVIGPRNPKARTDLTFEITLHLDPEAKRITLLSEGQPRSLQIREGEWSDWLKVKFKSGPFVSLRGMVRFYLVRIEPVLELYASPVNFDPDAPMFPISSPPDYAAKLAAQLGTFYTTGMVEDHAGLNNGRIDEAAYLDQCAIVLREREQMMHFELDRFDTGLFYCLFDTPDRLQHMFWRFREVDHPANQGELRTDLREVIEDHYVACDAIVGKAFEYADDRTLFIALSDHGMNSFQRGVHLNTWLHDSGYLALKPGVKPGEEAGDFFHGVDWDRTQAYAVGLGAIYLNLKGREEQGIVAADEAQSMKTAIAEGLAGLLDPERGRVAVRSVVTREQVYHGPFAAQSPDLLVNFAAGYRASWATPLGGVPYGHFDNNVKKWSGDHVIDPALVPGVLFMNRAFRSDNPSLLDLAPTILAALTVPKGSAMEGSALL